MVFHKSYRDMVLRMNDGAAENAFLTVSDGTLTIKWADEKNIVLDRGAIGQAGEVKQGDQVPAEVTFSYYLEKMSDVAVTGEKDTFYGAIEERITMDDFFYTSIDVQEGDPSKITISGKALVTLTTIS
jgi:hypothetical protein